MTSTYSSANSRSSRPRRSSRGGAVLGTIVGIVVVLALILAGAEFGTRALIANKISDSINNAYTARGLEADGDPQVSFGKTFVLPVLGTKHLQQLHVDVPSTLKVNNPAAVGGQPEIIGDPQALIKGQNVDVSNQNNPVAENLIIETTVPTDLLQAVANRRTGGAARISGLTPVPGEGNFNVELSSGFAGAKLAPKVVDGKLTGELMGASILGFNLDGLADLIGGGAADVISFDIGHGLTIESATVTDTGLALVLQGSNLPLSTMSELHFS